MNKETFKMLSKEYKIKERFKNYLVATNGEEEKSIFPSDKPIHFAFGKSIDRENLEEEVKKGNVLKTNGLEIYRHYYKWDEEKYFEEKHRMSRKMHNAIQAIMNDVHLIDVKVGSDTLPLEQKEEVKIRFKKRDLGYYQGKWIVEDLRSDFDDAWVNHFVFSEKPTQQDVDVAVEIYEIKTDVQFNKDAAINYRFLEELTGTPNEIKKQFVSAYFD
ncbi:hypothetical protein KM908_14670 [Alkalihalobacillus clausii]|uniref:hypothetical protein n=1 Tax=Shouchella clausii TaxID=79880 RepID=UPI001C22DA13|nr:hypothetical protein [Shouchella clausii]MBU8597387.1 hypothetical protein [Shouchella clausii]